MSRIFECRFAPVNTATRLGEFDAYCFAAAQRNPEGVYIDREHKKLRIGEVNSVFLRDGFWCCSFRLAHPAAEHGVTVGHPVSLECDTLRTRRGVHEACKLVSVSLVARPAIRGAEITSIVEIPDRPAIPTGTVVADPWLRAAQEAAAARGVLIRPAVGRVERIC